MTNILISQNIDFIFLNHPVYNERIKNKLQKGNNIACERKNKSDTIEKSKSDIQSRNSQYSLFNEVKMERRGEGEEKKKKKMTTNST